MSAASPFASVPRLRGCCAGHAGGNNTTENSTRLCVETVYGQRKVSQKFYPYLDFELAEETREVATERQMRLFGAHGISNYG